MRVGAGCFGVKLAISPVVCSGRLAGMRRAPHPPQRALAPLSPSLAPPPPYNSYGSTRLPPGGLSGAPGPAACVRGVGEGSGSGNGSSSDDSNASLSSSESSSSSGSHDPPPRRKSKDKSKGKSKKKRKAASGLPAASPSAVASPSPAAASPASPSPAAAPLASPGVAAPPAPSSAAAACLVSPSVVAPKKPKAPKTAGGKGSKSKKVVELPVDRSTMTGNYLGAYLDSFLPPAFFALSPEELMAIPLPVDIEARHDSDVYITLVTVGDQRPVSKHMSLLYSRQFANMMRDEGGVASLTSGIQKSVLNYTAGSYGLLASV